MKPIVDSSFSLGFFGPIAVNWLATTSPRSPRGFALGFAAATAICVICWTYVLIEEDEILRAFYADVSWWIALGAAFGAAFGGGKLLLRFRGHVGWDAKWPELAAFATFCLSAVAIISVANSL